MRSTPYTSTISFFCVCLARPGRLLAVAFMLLFTGPAAMFPSVAAAAAAGEKLDDDAAVAAPELGHWIRLWCGYHDDKALLHYRSLATAGEGMMVFAVHGLPSRAVISEDDFRTARSLCHMMLAQLDAQADWQALELVDLKGELLSNSTSARAETAAGECLDVDGVPAAGSCGLQDLLVAVSHDAVAAGLLLEGEDEAEVLASERLRFDSLSSEQPRLAAQTELLEPIEPIEPTAQAVEPLVATPLVTAPLVSARVTTNEEDTQPETELLANDTSCHKSQKTSAHLPEASGASSEPIVANDGKGLLGNANDALAFLSPLASDMQAHVDEAQENANPKQVQLWQSQPQFWAKGRRRYKVLADEHEESEA